MSDKTDWNEYDAILEDMGKKCLHTQSKEEYKACCNKMTSNCKEDNIPFALRTDETTTYNYYFPLIIIALVGVAILFFIAKLKLYRKILPPYSKFFYAVVSGWFLWATLVISYSQLFNEHLDYKIWLTLPPICFIFTILWLKKFILNKL